MATKLLEQLKLLEIEIYTPNSRIQTTCLLRLHNEGCFT